MLYIYLTTLCAAFSGFLFGYETGSLNGVKDMLGYRQTLNLSYDRVTTEGNVSSSSSCNHEDNVETSAILGLILSLFCVGGGLGALIGGCLADYAGRKPAMMVGGALVSISGLVHASAVQLWMALLSRIPAGLGIGILYVVTPTYLGEVSREDVRGRFLTALTLWTGAGYLLGVVMNIAVGQVPYGWRISLGVQIIAGALVALAMLFAPRSPRWLLLHGKEERARRVLRLMYKTNIASERYFSNIKSASDGLSLKQQLKLILKWNVFQRLLFGVGLFSLGRMTGGNFIGYFSVSILCTINLPGFIVSLAMAGSIIAALVLSIVTVDKLGRKILYLTGLGVMAVSMAVAVVLIHLFHLDISDPGGEEGEKEELGGVRLMAAYVTLVSFCFNMAGFMASCGSIPWIVMGELFPVQVKGLVTSVCNTTFWGSLLLSNQIFPLVISSPLGLVGVLYFFLAVTIFHYFYILLSMPETKGVTLENIERLYSMPWRDRVQPLHYLRCLCVWQLFGSAATKICHRGVEPRGDDGDGEVLLVHMDRNNGCLLEENGGWLDGEEDEVQDYGGGAKDIAV